MRASMLALSKWLRSTMALLCGESSHLGVEGVHLGDDVGDFLQIDLHRILVVAHLLHLQYRRLLLEKRGTSYDLNHQNQIYTITHLDPIQGVVKFEEELLGLDGIMSFSRAVYEFAVIHVPFLLLILAVLQIQINLPVWN